MKCPVCGKELAEKATFCIYCMTPLDEKREVTPRFFHKKRWLVLLAICLAVAVALPVVLVAVPDDVPEKAQTEPSATRRINTVPICSYFEFQDLAMYTQCTDWNPFFGYLLKADGRSELYLLPVYLEGASLKLLFEDGGCRIRGELTNVAPKDMDAAITVMHELMDMLCKPAKMNPVSVRFTGKVGSSQAVLSPQKSGYPEIYAYTELKQEGDTYSLILELS